MKKALKNLLSVVLCVAVALSCLFVVSGADIKASAYYGSNYITAGETYNFVLTYVDRGVAYFTPQVSGFYKLTITDHVRTGWIGLWINERDNTNDIYINNFYAYHPNQIINNYVSSYLYMRAGNEYEINVGYYAQSYYQTMTGGNMSVRFEKTDYTPPLIPSDTTGSNHAINDASQDKQYFRYHTSQEGDYTLSFEHLLATVNVYKADNGILVDSGRDSQYWKSGEDDDYIIGTKMVFKLEGDTTYYFCINNYYDEGSSPLYINKNEKDVSHILAESTDAPISCWSDELNVCYELNYKITYTDGTDDCMHSNDLQAAGYCLPEVTYGGKFIDIGYYRILGKGKKVPIHSEYDRYHSNTIYVNITSVAEELAAQGKTAIDEFSVGELANFTGHSYDYIAFQRVKVLETGIYHIEPAENSQWMDIDKLNPIILDLNNDEIVYNGTNESWALVGGQEYALIVEYSFSYHASRDDFSYGLVRDRKNIFPDTGSNQWYSDAVAYAYSTGIMKGYANGMFGTSDGIQRQDFLLMLARYSDVSPYSYAYSNLGGFTDLDSYAQYAYAVNWGYEKGIVTGYENGKFGVGDKITREQLVTFLYRYANYKGLDMTVTAKGKAKAKAYPDFALVSDFAEDAVIWAIDRGIINGKSGKIEPQGTAQRCEIAQIMYNIHTKNIF